MPFDVLRGILKLPLKAKSAGECECEVSGSAPNALTAITECVLGSNVKEQNHYTDRERKRVRNC